MPFSRRTRPLINPARLRALKDHIDDLAGRRVLLRVDLNVPLGPVGNILDDYRIRRTAGLVRRLQKINCRVAVVSHLGQPGGCPCDGLSLRPFVRQIADLLGSSVAFVPTCTGPAAVDALAALPPGGVALMENLRFHPGEEEGDPAFAAQLAALADAYVNDAFSVSHRQHASVVVTPRLLPAYAGPAFVDEYRRAWTMLQAMRAPVVVVAGGAKLDKLTTYQRLLPALDGLLLGSGMAGIYFTGDHPITRDAHRDRIHLPEDLVAVGIGPDHHVVAPGALRPGLRCVDLGPRTVERYERILRQAGTIFFNGSTGVLGPEHALASGQRLIRATVESRAVKVVCGGTGCSLFIQQGLARRVDFMFPGGGAILNFLVSQADDAVRPLLVDAPNQVAASSFEGESP